MNIENIKKFIIDYDENHPSEDFIQSIIHLMNMGVNIVPYYEDSSADINGQYFQTDNGIYRIPFWDMNTNELDIDSTKKCNREDIETVIDNSNSRTKDFEKLLEGKRKIIDITSNNKAIVSEKQENLQAKKEDIYVGIYMRDNEIYDVVTDINKDKIIQEMKNMIDDNFTKGLDYISIFLNNKIVWSYDED